MYCQVLERNLEQLKQNPRYASFSHTLVADDSHVKKLQRLRKESMEPGEALPDGRMPTFLRSITTENENREAMLELEEAEKQVDMFNSKSKRIIWLN